MTEPAQHLTRSNTTASLPSRPSHKSRHSIAGYDTASAQPQVTDEALYSHPSVKIVKFEPPKSAATSSVSAGNPSSTLPDLDYPVDAVETLPWRVSTERIAALGAMRLESVASATFLKAGSVIQPLLKNCQGWCVDGKSIFVLRIRRLTYYRIELPDGSDKDKQRVQSFKEVLARVIRYEVTPCPFQRGFSVELPEESKTPKRKKAWTPKHSPSVRMSRRDDEPSQPDSDPGEREMSDAGSTDGRSDDGDSPAVLGNRNRSRASICGDQISMPTAIPSRLGTRSATEPLRSFDSLVTQFQKASSPVVPEPEQDSLSTNIDLLHFSQDERPLSPSSPSSPTPSSRSRAQYTAKDLHIPPFRGHQRDLSDATVTSQDTITPERQDRLTLNIPQVPSDHPMEDTRPFVTPEQPIQSAAVPGDSGPTIRQRRQAPALHDISPPSSVSTLLSPSPRSPTHTAARSILRKTFTLVLDAPLHLALVILGYIARLVTASSKHEYQSVNDEHDGSHNDREGSSSEGDFGNMVTPNSSRESEHDSPVTPHPPGAWEELD